MNELSNELLSECWLAIVPSIYGHGGGEVRKVIKLKKK